MTKRIWIAMFLVWVAARRLPAQEEAAGEETKLNVELTLHAAPDGSDRETSFVLHVLADSKRTMTLRAGREVAVPAADNQYRNVGINVTCRAWTSGDGFRLDLELERSSLVEGSDPGRPSFHTFSTTSSFRLRDGESVELVGGPDLREIVAKLEVLRDYHSAAGVAGPNETWNCGKLVGNLSHLGRATTEQSLQRFCWTFSRSILVAPGVTT
jgi:hypothetical protein